MENTGFRSGSFDSLHHPSEDDDDEMVDIAGATLDFSATEDDPPLGSDAETHLSQSEPLPNPHDQLKTVPTSSANPHPRPRRISQSRLPPRAQLESTSSRREETPGMSFSSDWFVVFGAERKMDWEFWSKQLDQEVLVEGGELWDI
ncbi:hypothetical protein KUCAC02_037121 [Chaenocephalus aceratus]|nr:hypothetical protein KUCAC02_037121 [Chaenocephalus aceratus]